jgi:hypothetical protein
VPAGIAMNRYVNDDDGSTAHCDTMDTPSIHGVPRWYMP